MRHPFGSTWVETAERRIAVNKAKPRAATNSARYESLQAPYFRIVLDTAGKGRFESLVVVELAGKEGVLDESEEAEVVVAVEEGLPFERLVACLESPGPLDWLHSGLVGLRDLRAEEWRDRDSG